MLITSADLKTHSKNDLAQMAKRLGVSDWGNLSKDQLIAAIVKKKKAAANAGAAKKSDSKLSGKAAAVKPSKATSSSQASKKSSPSRSPTSKPAGKIIAKKAGKATAATKPAAAKPATSKAAASKPVASKPVDSKPVASKPVAKMAASKAAAKSVASSTDKTTINGKSHAKANGSVADRTEAKASAKDHNTKVSKSGKSTKPDAVKPDAGKSSESKPVDSQLTAGESASPKSSPSKPSLSEQVVPKKPAAKKPVKPAAPPTDPEVLQRIREMQVQRESTKDLAAREFEEVPRVEPPKPEPAEEGQQKDRIVLVVRDCYWLHVTWDITRRAVERARAAMAEHWHHAHPILRLLRLDDSGTTSAAETIERDIVIHGGVRNWYVDLNGTPGRFRVMIGYLSGTRFHMLAKSNIVRTPTAGTTEAVEDHWSDIARDAERIFALSGGYDSEQETTELQEVFEDRLKRSMGGPQLVQYGSGAETAFRGRGGFHFDMEVELYVYGSTVPDGFVTLNNEPIKLRSDGTFAMRLPFPDRRQVLPAVACSRDGVQQRTVVIAVERNTKVMEPFSKEQDDQG